MSGSLNKVILIGNLGKDPELKALTSGQSVARFSLATTETWKDKDGAKQSKTEWHNVVVWGKQAEIAEKYLRKGKQVMVEGRVQYREYTDQAGVKKTVCDIRCDNFVMLGRADEAGGGFESQRVYETPASDPTGASGGTFPDDDVPF